ncbi:MAG TPA: zinc ribbon domain-containing protein [Polyangia bacterium]|nr:zinc ribbon domain-containing protein [Polyangia bacterium]
MKEQTLSADAGAPKATASAPPRRRVPAIVLGLGGAFIAAVYGVTVMHMRMGAPLVMLALGGLTLVLSGIALWRVLDPLSRAGVDVASPSAPRGSGRLRELEREKQLVLKAIKEVELDYQMRKIAEPDYKDMVERYRARALRLIGELEAGDNFRPLIERELRDRLAAAESAKAAVPAETATAGLCPSCSTRNDEDAQFCKKCGGKLGSS